MIRRLHTDMATNLYRFRDIREEAQTQLDKARWSLLSDLHHRYLTDLKEAGLVDANVVHLDAVRFRHCRSAKTMVLISTVDLSELQRAMLRIATDNVIALVGLSAEQAEMVDEFGVVRTDQWLDHKLTVTDEQLITASDIADQTGAIADAICQLGDRSRSDSMRLNQITVGVTDESHVAPTEMHLRHVSLPADPAKANEESPAKTIRTHRHLGWTVGETAIGRLVSLTTTYLQRRNWPSLAALVRHADVHR